MASKIGVMPKLDKAYQAECDLRTLIEAKKIMADKGRFNAALKKRKEMMADHQKEMAAIQSLDEEKGEY